MSFNLGKKYTLPLNLDAPFSLKLEAQRKHMNESESGRAARPIIFIEFSFQLLKIIK
jgi:hypothetical protein